ncbi:MAG: tetratricopeptide repeat protein, partial [Myxococcota bacterium]
WVALHRACAAIGIDGDDPDELVRRGRHRANAGDPDAELDFHQALQSAHARDPRWTVELVERWDAIPLDGDPRRPPDPDVVRRRCEGWALGARAARMCGRSAAARRWIDLCRARATERGWTDLEPRLLHEEGGLAQDLGRPTEARAWFAAAARAATNDAVRLSAQLAGAGVALELGELDTAAAAFTDVIDGAAALPLLAARARVSLGAVRLQQGEPDVALSEIGQALPVLDGHGSRWDLAQAHNQLAEAHRATGDLAQAEQHYRRARELHRDLGSWAGVFAELNLHLIGFARGRHAAQEPGLERILWFARQDGRPVVEVAARACLIRVAAQAGRWDKVAAHLAPLTDRLAQTRMVHADLAALLSDATAIATDAEAEVAVPLRALADTQVRALDRA